MKARNIVITALYTLSMLAAMAGSMYFGLCYLYPGFAAAGLQLKLLAVTLAVGIPYYLSALTAFFVSPQCLTINNQGKGLEIAGRSFFVNADFFNPANHIIIASLGLFLGLGIVFLTWNAG